MTIAHLPSFSKAQIQLARGTTRSTSSAASFTLRNGSRSTERLSCLVLRLNERCNWWSPNYSRSSASHGSLINRLDKPKQPYFAAGVKRIVRTEETNALLEDQWIKGTEVVRNSEGQWFVAELTYMKRMEEVKQAHRKLVGHGELGGPFRTAAVQKLLHPNWFLFRAVSLKSAKPLIKKGLKLTSISPIPAQSLKATIL
jgi:hypothetical protein